MNVEKDFELNISYHEQSHKFKFNSKKNNINDIIKFSQQNFYNNLQYKSLYKKIFVE